MTTIIIDKKAQIVYTDKRVTLSNSYITSTEFKENEGYVTAGSGGNYAKKKGGLAANISPKEAITAASLCDAYTNNLVDEYIL